MMGEGNGTPVQYSCLENPMDGGAWWAAVHEVAKSQTQLSDFTFTFHLHALEKEMATHSSVLAWRIPGTGEPGRLPSVGSHRVRYDWSDLAAAAAYINDTMQYLSFCLASFRIMPSGFIYFVANGSISFSWLNTFPVCCVCLHVCHVFLSIYPPVDTLDTEVISMSWLLWIMRHWTQGCGYLFEILFSFPLAIYPEVGTLVVLFFSFCGNSIFSIVIKPVYIPTSSAQGSFFSTSSPT